MKQKKSFGEENSRKNYTCGFKRSESWILKCKLSCVLERGKGFQVKLSLFVSLGFCKILRWPSYHTYSASEDICKELTSRGKNSASRCTPPPEDRWPWTKQSLPAKPPWNRMRMLETSDGLSNWKATCCGEPCIYSKENTIANSLKLQ